MDILRNGSGPGAPAPESTFTGDVRIRGYFQREVPSRLVGAAASFSPGSRTPWKTNPAGQTVLVTGGVGWAQCDGEPVVEIHAGDLIWFPPGVRHWEGAAPDQPMHYVALHEGGVRFEERVTDAEYASGGRR